MPYLDKLHGELAIESGHLSLDTELPASYREGNDFIMSCTVPYSIKDIQVFYNYMAI